MILTDIEAREISKYTYLYNFSSELRGKTILITGSKGIVGSGIIKWLLFENKNKGLDCRIVASTRDVINTPTYIECDDNIIYIKYGNELEECSNMQIDYIVHSAAPTSNKVFASQPVESLNVIISGTERILKLAKMLNSKMIYLSSEEVYGASCEEKPITEDYVGAINSLSTRSCYPLGKKVAELLCRSYFEEYGVDVRIIRPTVILGLWQDYDSVKVEAEILRCIIEKKNLYMLSDGSTKKSVIYSLDAVSAVLLALTKGNAGEVYNATNPDTFCSVKERVMSAFAEFNPKLSIDFADVDDSQRNGYLPKRSLCEDITKIKSLGWKPYYKMNDIYNIDLERFNYGKSI